MIDIEQLKNKKIIIFGAGIAGQGILKVLRHKNIPVYCFFDNKAAKSWVCEGVSVQKLDLAAIDKEKVLFILTIHDTDEAIDQLSSFGITNYIQAYELIDDEAKTYLNFMEIQKIEGAWFYYERFYKTDLLTLNSLDFILTERCSLKCKECSNLMQFYKQPENYDLEYLKKELDRLSEIFDEIYEIRLLGGEPFMYPYISEIMEYIKTKENIKRISIYTNGTILPKDSVFETIKKTGTWFSISNYHELSYKKNEIIAKLKEYEIPYECKTIDYWTRCSTFTKHNRSEEALKKVYLSCCTRNIVTLIKGKIYGCPFISNAMNLNAIPQCASDYVDIFENGDLEKIKGKLKLLLNRDFYDSCDWCQGRPTPEYVKESDKIPPHEQIKMPLPYDEIDMGLK